MFGRIWALFLGVNNFAGASFDYARVWAINMIFGLWAGIGVMWLISVYGNPKNIYFFIGFGVYAIIHGLLNYGVVGGTAVAGGLLAWFQDKDFSQGMVSGLKVIAILGGMSLFCFIAFGFILLKLPFAVKPELFWDIFIIVVLAGLAYGAIPWAPMKHTIGIIAILVLGYTLYDLREANVAANKPLTPSGAGAEGGGAASAPEGPQYTPTRTATPSMRRVEERQMTTSSAQQNPVATSRITTPTWEKPSEDGNLPMEEWSKSLMIDPGCGVTFDAGNCVKYVVRFRYQGGEWSEHTCAGAFPTGDEVQFKVLEPMKKVPVRLTCS